MAMGGDTVKTIDKDVVSKHCTCSGKLKGKHHDSLKSCPVEQVMHHVEVADVKQIISALSCGKM
jgi:hypothetical protein